MEYFNRVVASRLVSKVKSPFDGGFIWYRFVSVPDKSTVVRSRVQPMATNWPARQGEGVPRKLGRRAARLYGGSRRLAFRARGGHDG